ncbi:ThuA domain-containing protein [Micromonospora zamorensis]
MAPVGRDQRGDRQARRRRGPGGDRDHRRPTRGRTRRRPPAGGERQRRPHDPDPGGRGVRPRPRRLPGPRRQPARHAQRDDRVPQLATWRSTVGAAWDHGRTFHPPIGSSLIRRTDIEHPITTGLVDFEVHDERYTDLELLDGVDVDTLYVHDEGGDTHPLVWARTAGSSRIVYNALGHDARSYESPEHVELLRRIVHWLRHRI